MNLFTKQKQTHRQQADLWLPKGNEGRDKLGIWDYQIHSTIYVIGNLQAQGTLLNIL